MIDTHRQLHDFADLVDTMLRAQRRYFALAPGFEKRLALDECKRLEREVAKALAAIKAPELEL